MSAFARLAADYASSGSELSSEEDDAAFAARYFDPVSRLEDLASASSDDAGTGTGGGGDGGDGGVGGVGGVGASPGARGGSRHARAGSDVSSLSSDGDSLATDLERLRVEVALQEQSAAQGGTAAGTANGAGGGHMGASPDQGPSPFSFVFGAAETASGPARAPARPPPAAFTFGADAHFEERGDAASPVSGGDAQRQRGAGARHSASPKPKTPQSARRGASGSVGSSRGKAGSSRRLPPRRHAGRSPGAPQGERAPQGGMPQREQSAPAVPQQQPRMPPSPAFRFGAGESPAARHEPAFQFRAREGAGVSGHESAGASEGVRAGESPSARAAFRFAAGESTPAPTGPAFHFSAGAAPEADTGANRSPSKASPGAGRRGTGSGGGSGGSSRARAKAARKSEARRVLRERNADSGRGSDSNSQSSPFGPELQGLRAAAEARRVKEQQSHANGYEPPARASSSSSFVREGSPMAVDGSYEDGPTSAEFTFCHDEAVPGVQPSPPSSPMPNVEASTAAARERAAARAAAALRAADAALAGGGDLGTLSEDELFELHSCLRAAMRRARLAGELPDEQVTAATTRVTTEMEKRHDAMKTHRERVRRGAPDAPGARSSARFGAGPHTEASPGQSKSRGAGTHMTDFGAAAAKHAYARAPEPGKGVSGAAVGESARVSVRQGHASAPTPSSGATKSIGKTRHASKKSPKKGGRAAAASSDAQERTRHTAQPSPYPTFGYGPRGAGTQWRDMKASADRQFHAGLYEAAAASYEDASALASKGDTSSGAGNASSSELAVLRGNFAAALMMVGRSREALAACEEALALDAGYRRARQRAAACALRLGRAADAAARFARCEAEARAAGDANGVDTAVRGGDSARAVRAMVGSALAAMESAGATAAAAGPVVDVSDVASIEGAVKGALQDLNVAIADAPECCALRCMRARSLLAVGRFADAEAEGADTVAELERKGRNGRLPSETRQLSWQLRVRACARLGLGDLDGGLKALADAIAASDSLSPRDWEEGTGEATSACVGAAVYALERADLIAASSKLAELVEINSRRIKGNAAFSNGKHDEAEVLYTEALQFGSSEGEGSGAGATAGRFALRLRAACFCNRAAAAHASGRRAIAAADCGRALALDRWYSKAWSRRAAIHAELGEDDEATDLEAMVAILQRTGAPRSERDGASDRLRQARRARRRTDPFAWLGLRKREAGAADVKKAYRKLALVLHPDKAAAALVRGSGGAASDAAIDFAREDANRLFSKVGAAHEAATEALKNPEADLDDLYGTFGGSNRSSSFPGERSRGGSRGPGGGYSRAYTRQRSASASSAGSSYARSNSYGGGAYGSNRRSWSGYDYSYGF